MSFSKRFFFLVFALTLMLSLPGIAEEEQEQKVKFTINLGGLLTTVSQGYECSFDVEDVDATWTELVPNAGDEVGFDVGIGIFPISQLEVYASYSGYKGTTSHLSRLRLPHVVYDEIVSDSLLDVENDFSTSAFNFGFAFHPIKVGIIKPYFGVGLSNVKMKIEVADSASVDENVLAEYYQNQPNPPYEWQEFYHTIDITEIGFTEKSETVWGIHAKLGTNVEVARHICIFAEARYLSATAKFNRPDITVKVKSTVDLYLNDAGSEYESTVMITDEKKVNVDDTVEIKAGGIQGIIGIKLSF